MTIAPPCPRLIEVALPIREISAESVRDKSLRHGHISTLHLWWARRPLAASRAVVFASLVPDPDDPDCPPDFRAAVLRLLRDQVPAVLKGYWRKRRFCQDPDPYRPYEGVPDTPRNRLLTFVAKWSPESLAFERGQTDQEPKPAELLDDRSLVKWETSDPESEHGRAVLGIARELVRTAYGGQTPNLLDPFAGGGAIPLEAGRLGCQAIANDYNPVAYLILRATCEFPQKYGKPGKRAVEQTEYGHTVRREIDVPNVLAYDVEHWAKWILERARAEIGHLYPPGRDGRPVVGYLWARTAPCSNPACRAEIPLLRSMLVCDKPAKRVALEMDVRGKQTFFAITRGKAITRTEGTMIPKGMGNARCPVCQQVTPVRDLRHAFLEGRAGERLVAAVIDTPQGKDYRVVEPADLEAVAAATRVAQRVERPGEYIVPEINAPHAPHDAGAHRSISIDVYGFKTFGLLFNARQLVAMQTLAHCLREALAALSQDVTDSGYGAAISVYLGLWLSRISQRANSFCTWNPSAEKVQPLYGRQALAMVWDYPEIPAFSESMGSPTTLLGVVTDVIKREGGAGNPSSAEVHLGDAAQLGLGNGSAHMVITDPPYFDSIAYADLSDFFYVWLKRGLGTLLPEAFSTPQTPKQNEVVAHKHRHHGSREEGQQHFQRRLTASLAEVRRICRPDGLTTIMFAHQSTEAWSALVSAIFEAGLNITASYPIDTELTTALKRSVAALASSISVVCRPRQVGAAVSFRDVRREIERAVADAVHRFWDYGFRGADLIVACYGPAVGVFGRYERVERADGTPVTVPELLELAKESALRAIAGEFEGDALSRLYFVWANLYGATTQAWDDARLVVQVGGEGEDAMDVARRRGLFVLDGPTCRLALLRDRAGRPHLGQDPAAPLIDQLHHAMQLWKEEHRADLVRYLRLNALADHAAFWKLAQALFEVLPRGEEDWKLVSALLGERETLRVEARRAEPPLEPPAQPALFEV